MKSMLIDDEIHQNLKILAAETKRSLKDLLAESFIDLLDKHGKEIPENVRFYYGKR